ncbi:DEAD/DEAH box RNA helicase family protein isoform X2 [Tasmannia lanceolata]|uniref:DEAD/DEAH box RNA helicase family protein isoform X2 n=1 Tax=Tasmannia lanceolata TaxID=3420 RepID=UPI004063280C
MSSCLPQPVDDDDEFDWEAAVKEIDVACQSVASTSNREGFDNNLIPYESLEGNGSCPNLKKFVNVRQSTLDRFVQTDQKRGGFQESSHRNGSVSHRGDIDNLGEETICNNIDLEAAQTWIYPVNVPLRDYQLSIAEKALFSNTLVALPTGLGKTLIAAVVMYNYFRWFPEGLMNPSKRSHFWKAKRVFFVTPQVLEKDIHSGTCLVKKLICLVIDEAHRAMGNYSYCVAVRELMAVPVQLRILALTATPGSKQGTIQSVIDNLHISTLEYRNESDHDVSPYVHDRKLELIEVPMGKDATEINNLLLEAIQPFMAKLCAVGVLQKRDFGTLSPCELLNSRDKFRQAPPLSLPHAKYGDVEKCFGVLITLYHIRKLLSSHGIRPAYEMLVEKLQPGPFVTHVRNNGPIWQAKLLMEQSLSHGAPNPKLLKMKEILTNHFKTKNPKESRVIIFSNFRGSVKDIMDSLSKIEDLVKAEQFIGQSSGKSLKGQTQKMQQEVLQKFRAGEHNVIVATSIGEEGLDIMEVDLVICFDANISPLRMIQRMGRTGRKHNGRVVVLACEGSELKGYLRKKANSKTITKHMHNGGTNSFDFHPSPRMVPHICKPQVQFVELSIEKFVPRGRKVKDDHMHIPICGNKMSDAETDIIAKYFHPSREVTWRPSLIAFPHFQAFPSGVHKVRHSFRTTGMLIDTIQCLQGLSSNANKTLMVKVMTSDQLSEAMTVAQDENSTKDPIHDAQIAFSERKIADVEASATETSRGKVDCCIPDIQSQRPPLHCFLFGADFVSVNTFGRVLISSVPVLPFMKEIPTFTSIPAKIEDLPKTMEHVTSPRRTSPVGNDRLSVQSKDNLKLTDYTEAMCINECIITSQLPNPDANQEQPLHITEQLVPQTPTCIGKFIDSEDHTVEETPSDLEKKTKTSLARESRGDLREMELSPRLTNFIEKGIVPESPIVESRHYSSIMHHSAESIDSHEKNDSLGPAHLSLDIMKFCGGTSSKKLDSEKNEMVTTQTELGENNLGMGKIASSPIIKEIHTPLINQINNSSSEGWRMSSGEISPSIQQSRKFKRLRKYGDIGKRLPFNTLKEEVSGTRSDLNKSFAGIKLSRVKQISGKQKLKTHVEAFIEEEAEVSLDAEVSEDEDDNKDDNEYDDSFIDDRVDPTAANAQAETSGGDMMSFYRRSLLTQSPMECQPKYSTNSSHESPSPRTAERGSCSPDKINSSLQTPHSSLLFANKSTGKNSVSCILDVERVTLINAEGESSSLPTDNETKTESRKRKLSFQQVETDPAMSFRQEHLFQSEVIDKASLHCEDMNNEINNDLFYDDQFYEGLDLDAMEAQATKFLRYKTNLSIQRKQVEIPNPSAQIEVDIVLASLNSPSFDLGI